MIKDIFTNPEVIRNARYRLRPKTVWLTIFITAAFLILVAIMAFNPLRDNAHESWRNLFVAYAWIATVTGFFYGVSLTTMSVMGEKDKKTYDFMFMTPLSDSAISIGKLIGSSLHMWLILAIMTLFLLVSGLGGEIAPVKMLVFYLALILGSLLCAACGMLVSVSITRTTSSLVGVLIVLGVCVISSGLGMGSREYDGYLQFYGLLSPVPIIMDISEELSRWYDPNIISFFNRNINAGLLTIAIYAWLIFWIMRAVIRKVRNLQGVYFTELEALIIFVVFEVLMAGFQWKYMSNPYGKHFWDSLATYLITNGIFLAVFSCGLTLSREDYFSYVRQGILKTPAEALRKLSPPHILYIILCLTMIGGLLMIPFRTDNLLLVGLEIWVLIAAVSIFYLLVQFLRTILVYAGPVVAIIISAAALGLPPIFLAAFGVPDKYFVWFNPIAYITQIHWFLFRLGTDYYYHYRNKPFTNTDLWFLPVLLAVMLAMMLVFFIVRHNQIKRTIRHRMKM
ncbi:MAG: ABC transporter permease [Planctomycetota bacterium]